LGHVGAGAWLAEHVEHALDPVWLFVLIGAVLALTEFVSNAATVAMLLPVALPMGGYGSVSPEVVALAVAVPAGFAFLLPMGTPANALAAAQGVPASLMLRLGWPLTLAAWFLTALAAEIWWPRVFGG
ncbi:MAG: sodium/sulfate symporter, partial [Zetaproteobacteria bacterium]